MEKKYKDHIGVFDSGVGGLSILKALRERMPFEDYIYYGDSANAPYGEKTKEEIEKLSLSISGYLSGCGVKAIVIACNTATSAASHAIREKFPDIPVIGEEPALKPAYLSIGRGRILVMATNATLNLEKFRSLYEKYKDLTDFILCDCTGLADIIEYGDLDGKDVNDKLNEILGRYKGGLDAVVLGCTHYPLVKKSIRKILGDIPMFDGSEGTARELERRLRAENKTAENTGSCGRVVFETSCDDKNIIGLYKKIFDSDF